jgi:DNA-binding NarL/FixJ family response regulator
VDEDAVTVAILDDHPAVVAGVEAWCSAARPIISVIDVGGRIAELWTGAGAAADVIVFDLHLGDRSPAFRDLRMLADSDRRIIVYSQRSDAVTALTCLEMGAFTYLTKAEGKPHLVPAIQACAAGRPYTSPSLAGAMAGDTRTGRPSFSPRETEVMLAWFACDSKAMVAAKLGLSVKTVETYLDRVRLKYANAGRAARTKAALMERALQDGLTDLDRR